MGDACSTENLKAIINGHLNSEGFTLPHDGEVPLMTLNQRYHYEEQMAAPWKTIDAQLEKAGLELKFQDRYNHLDGPFKEQLAKWEGAEAPSYKTAKSVISGVARYVVGGGLKGRNRDTDAPSRLFGDQIYESIAGEIRDLHMRYGSQKSPDFQEAYRGGVAKKARAEKQTLEKMVRLAKDTGELDAMLRDRYGIERQQAYDLHSWLGYLEKPFERGPRQDNIFEMTVDRFLRGATSRTAPVKLTWIVGNIGDAGRSIAYFGSQPGGMKAVIQGIADTFAGKQAFSKNTDLERQGMYDMSRGLEGDLVKPEGNLFAWTNNLQVNIAYNIGNRFDGNGKKAVQDLAFHHEWFNQPHMMRNMRNPVMQNLAFGLLRYTINENIWVFNQARWALTGKTPQVKASAAGSLLGYSLIRAAVFGSASVIPAPLYWAFGPAYEAMTGEKLGDSLREFDRSMPFTNLAGKAATMATSAGAKTVGLSDAGNYEINFGEWAQPFGGSALIRAQQFKDAIPATGNLFLKGMKAAGQGDAMTAGVDLMAAGLSGAMFLDVGPLWMVNDLTARAFRKVGTEMHGSGNYTKALMETVAGYGNVKEVE